MNDWNEREKQPHVRIRDRKALRMGSRPLGELVPRGLRLVLLPHIARLVRALGRVCRRSAAGCEGTRVCASVADRVRVGFAPAADLVRLHQSPFGRRSRSCRCGATAKGRPAHAGSSEFSRRRSAATTLPAAGARRPRGESSPDRRPGAGLACLSAQPSLSRPRNRWIAAPIAPCPCGFCESRWPRRTPSTLRCSRSTPS